MKMNPSARDEYELFTHGIVLQRSWILLTHKRKLYGSNPREYIKKRLVMMHGGQGITLLILSPVDIVVLSYFFVWYILWNKNCSHRLLLPYRRSNVYKSNASLGCIWLYIASLWDVVHCHQLCRWACQRLLDHYFWYLRAFYRYLSLEEF